MGLFITFLVTLSFGLGLFIGYKCAQSENKEYDKELEEFFNSLRDEA
jgi:hypothetical protein